MLDLLERRHQVTGGTIFLLDADTRELHVEATVGTRLGVQRARVRPGDGITERVIDTGKPVVVPRASQEPALAAAAGERARGRELTYLAVPIAVGRRPGGTLEVVLTYKQDRDYQRSLEFYRVVASMIAPGAQAAAHSRSRPQQAGGGEPPSSVTSCEKSTKLRSLIGNIRSMQQIYDQVAQVARTNTTVLIRGESGTGKELVAHAVHYSSPRAEKPFVKVNCGAIRRRCSSPSSSVTRRAPSPARSARKKGRFELAHGGTLFLDEVGELTSRRRSSSCASCRSASSSAWAAGDHQGGRAGDRRHQQGPRGG